MQVPVGDAARLPNGTQIALNPLYDSGPGQRDPSRVDNSSRREGNLWFRKIEKRWKVEEGEEGEKGGKETPRREGVSEVYMANRVV